MRLMLVIGTRPQIIKSAPIVHELMKRRVDFLFIDGDHSYEGVRKDFEMYNPFVREGGIIAFHDIIHPKFGVIKFWNEIKHRYASKEIVASTHEMCASAQLDEDKHGWEE